MIYAGIGARKTPKHIQKSMTNVAKFLGKSGFILRSGAADGADSAFESGCDEVDGKKEIFLPWRGFNKHSSEFNHIGTEAYKVSREFHPNWDKLSIGAKKLMARNVYQILGKNHDEPVDFIICWTPKGAITGGTGQALRIAKHYKIPVFNLGKGYLSDIEEQILNFIESKKNVEKN